MVFPDRFIAALARHTYPVSIEKDGLGWRYHVDLGIDAIGYRQDPQIHNFQRRLMIQRFTIGTAMAIQEQL